MQSHGAPPGPETASSDAARDTDYASDLARSESHAVSTAVDPLTGERVKRAATILGVVLLLGFVAVRIDRFIHDRALEQAAQRALTAPRPVDVIEAQSLGAMQSFALPGETAAWHASTIYARVSGYVGKWFSDIGDRVTKGQVLALIETPDLDAELQAAQAQLRASQALVSVRQAEAHFAQTTYERWRDSPKGVVSEQEREEKRADYDGAVARLKSSEAQVGLDRARVDQYSAMSQFKQVVAPFDGVITSRYIDIGNLVTAGSTTATTPLYVLTQSDPMRVFVDVPQSAAADLMNVRVPVSVQTSDGATRAYSGTVARTSQAINAQARTLRVEVDLPNPDQHLVPGMYVNVDFSLQPKGLVQVPAAALLFRAGGPQVARVDRNGRVAFQNVTIARDDGSLVELGSGVSPGDRLALNLSSQISDGDLVKVNELGGRNSPAELSAER